MPDLTVTNWFGDLVSHPQVVAEANSVDDIVNILKDADRYPSPVRAVGSNHSTTACGEAESGTLVRMKMNRILNVGADSVTVEAGALYIDIAEELHKHKLQFHINTEIGKLTAGSAACCGTKDSSFPGEFGQVGSYVIGVKLVLPSGELLEATEDQPELLRKVRASYGLFGIVYEVTFRVRPFVPLAVHHKTYSSNDLIAALPELKALDNALMFYVFPFDDKITVEFRAYNADAQGDPDTHVWPLRNFLWGTAGPKFSYETEKNFSNKTIRYGIIDKFNGLARLNFETVIRSDNTNAYEEMIRYPDVADNSRYTFTFWAFPEEKYPEVLTAYFQFCRDYYKNQGYRSNMLSVGYRIAQDRQSLLSYSYDGPMITIDPVSTANPGWFEFLAAYNEFSAAAGGIPLLNQTFGLTPAMVANAYGDRWQTIADTRKIYDPSDRLLNPYFRALLPD